MAQVTVRQLVKKYGELEVVHGIDFDIGDREFCVLVGPSGCGKSTILRMIAGLESVSGGEVAINGRVVNDDAPRERDIAMVFQDYALYPHMSVRQNLGFGLKMRGRAARGDRRGGGEDGGDPADREPARPPAEGALRRPAAARGDRPRHRPLARALPVRRAAVEPRRQARVEMRTQIKRLHMAFGATSLYVTHDQTEAMTLADRIVALRDGRIEQMGSPDDLYARPVNRFVAGFIGSPTMNFLPARLVAEGDGLFLVPEGGPRLPVPPARAERYGRFAGKAVVLGLRPEDFTNTWTEESRDGSGVVPLDVTVEIAEPLGSDTLVFSRLGTSEIVGRLSAPPRLPSGRRSA